MMRFQIVVMSLASIFSLLLTSNSAAQLNDGRIDQVAKDAIFQIGEVMANSAMTPSKETITLFGNLVDAHRSCPSYDVMLERRANAVDELADADHLLAEELTYSRAYETWVLSNKERDRKFGEFRLRLSALKTETEIARARFGAKAASTTKIPPPPSFDSLLFDVTEFQESDETRTGETKSEMSVEKYFNLLTHIADNSVRSDTDLPFVDILSPLKTFPIDFFVNTFTEGVPLTRNFKRIAGELDTLVASLQESAFANSSALEAQRRAEKLRQRKSELQLYVSELDTLCMPNYAALATDLKRTRLPSDSNLRDWIRGFETVTEFEQLRRPAN